MLASITPLGERARQHRWAVTAGIYIFGTAAGGAAVGVATSLLGLLILGSVPFSARLGVIAAALSAGLAVELVRHSVPGPHRQVDERWLMHYRRWVYAGGYGIQLGAGVVTIVVSSSVYVVWVASLASASPGAGALIGAGAGAMRGASLLASARVVTPARLVAFHKRMAERERPARRLTLVAQLALATAAILTALSV